MSTNSTYLLKMPRELKLALKRVAWKRRKTIRAVLLDTLLANDPELRTMFNELTARAFAAKQGRKE